MGCDDPMSTAPGALGTGCLRIVEKRIVCHKHRRYQAKRKPRSSCKTCWFIWNRKEAT